MKQKNATHITKALLGMREAIDNDDKQAFMNLLNDDTLHNRMCGDQQSELLYSILCKEALAKWSISSNQQ